MAKIGWHSKLTQVSFNIWEAHRLLEESKERRAHNEGLAELLALLKELAVAGDINVLLTAERFILNQELSLYANSAEEHNSIKIALLQLDDAQKAFGIVVFPEAYQKATDTYSSKRTENGLPLDGFREFIKSHATRLANRLAGQLSGPEKEILRQRKANLLVAKDVYVALQKKALHIN